MWNAKLTIAYNGTNYVGWQVQDNGVSVQEKLEKAWKEVTGESLRITASGRTDSGVHALGQVCNCKTNTEINPERLCRALHSRTPEDITVFKIEKAVDDFHAIRDAASKTYLYRLQHGRFLCPLYREYFWHVRGQIDSELIRRAGRLLVGEHDFAGFESSGSPRNTTVRTISELSIRDKTEHGFEFIDIEISANGFLYNMARNIVGTLVEVASGRRDLDWFREIMHADVRFAAGMTAPAKGLCLLKVIYADDHLESESTKVN